MHAPNIGFEDDDLSEEGRTIKEETRQRTIRIVQESVLLWSPEHKALRCGWLELAGPDAPMLKRLLDAGVLRPDVCPRGHFYGVDRDPAVIDSARARYTNNEPATWLLGALRPMLRPENAFSDVGVLVFDSYDSLQGQQTAHDNLAMILRFARRQQEKLGEFLLVLNFAADPRHVEAEDVDEYRALLSKAFDVEFDPATFQTYRSRRTLMCWTAVRLGF